MVVVVILYALRGNKMAISEYKVEKRFIEKLHEYADKHDMTLTAAVERAVQQMIERDGQKQGSNETP